MDTVSGVEQKERILIFKAEKEEIELKKLKNEVLDSEDVCQSVMQILNILKAELMAIPGRVAPQLENKSVAEMTHLIEDNLSIALNQASLKLKELSNESAK